MKLPYIEANTLNELTYDACVDVLNNGIKIESRNGLCYELEDVDLILTDPRKRYLYLKGRTNNIFATFAEVFWVFGGNGVLFPIMTTVLPRCINYSDDLGYSWRGNYSERIFTNDQIGNVLNQFKQDTINTRRALLTIWRPDMDSAQVIGEVNKTKDLPCNNIGWFWVRDNKFNMKMGTRSNDLVYGLSNINAVEWTVLQELLCDMISKELDIPLELGYYHHSAISLHVYEFTERQARNIILNPFVDCKNTKILPAFINYQEGISKSAYFREFFKQIHDIIAYYSTIRFSKPDISDVSMKEVEKTAEKIFGDNHKHNALYWYFMTVLAFILAKNNIGEMNTVEQQFKPYEKELEELFPEFHYAVVNNHFYKKNVTFNEEESLALEHKYKHIKA